jgi:hypothetical protein
MEESQIAVFRVTFSFSNLKAFSFVGFSCNISGSYLGLPPSLPYKS